MNPKRTVLGEPTHARGTNSSQPCPIPQSLTTRGSASPFSKQGSRNMRGELWQIRITWAPSAWCYFGSFPRVPLGQFPRHLRRRLRQAMIHPEIVSVWDAETLEWLRLDVLLYSQS